MLPKRLDAKRFVNCVPKSLGGENIYHPKLHHPPLCIIIKHVFKKDGIVTKLHVNKLFYRLWSVRLTYAV